MCSDIIYYAINDNVRFPVIVPAHIRKTMLGYRRNSENNIIMSIYRLCHRPSLVICGNDRVGINCYHVFINKSLLLNVRNPVQRSNMLVYYFVLITLLVLVVAVGKVLSLVSVKCYSFFCTTPS